MRYRRTHTLRGTGHTAGISRIAFSPDGDMLATSDMDGKTCIWNVSTGGLLYLYDASTAALALAWSSPHILLCGLKDGTITSLKIDSESGRLYISGSWSHQYPVECLAYQASTGRLASGAHAELFVWKEDDLVHPEVMLEPPSGPGEVLVTGIHWLDAACVGFESSLIASYMHHGITIFDTSTWSPIDRFRQDCRLTTSISVDPTGTFVAVSNLDDGFDIHRIKTGALVSTIPHDFGDAYPIPVLYIHGGYGIVGGSTLGHASIWYVDEESPVKQQTLDVPGGMNVLAIAAHYDEQADQFRIATGLADADNPVVVVWTAQEPKAPAVEDAPEDANTPSSQEGSTCCLSLAYLLGAMLVVAAACYVAVLRTTV